MSTVNLCDHDGQPIDPAQPSLGIQYITFAPGDGSSRYLTPMGNHHFHNGLCAAAWLGGVIERNMLPENPGQPAPEQHPVTRAGHPVIRDGTPK